MARIHSARLDIYAAPSCRPEQLRDVVKFPCKVRGVAGLPFRGTEYGGSQEVEENNKEEPGTRELGTVRDHDLPRAEQACLERERTWAQALIAIATTAMLSVATTEWKGDVCERG